MAFAGPVKAKEEDGITRLPLSEGITIIKEVFSKPVKIEYQVENKTLSEVDVTIDLEGSINVEFSDGHREAVAHVRSFHTRRVGTVHPIDKDAEWDVKADFKAKIRTKVPEEAEPESVVVKKELQPNLTIIRTQTFHPTRFVFELDNQLRKACKITVDFAESTNLGPRGDAATLEGDCPPKFKSKLGTAVVHDSEGSWELVANYKWSTYETELHNF
eukprot:m.85041 g.85041  ORF g.85041 m.85041 type:complete len:216 (-) comp14704_c0_seq1:1906-2553(-)